MIPLHKIHEHTNWETLLSRPTTISKQNLFAVVKPIFDDIAQRGMQAVADYTKQFDHWEGDAVAIQPEEIKTSYRYLSDELREAIQLAAKNIRTFHRSQWRKISRIQTTEGVSCWQKEVPVEKVGLYVPGGTAPLLSTVLMLGIPAQIAKCKNVILCTPPSSQGTIAPEILFAASVCNIQQIYKVGGIQAIAALSLGTEEIPKVDKIFGPGNAYVTAAKQYAFLKGTAIDLPAGPSEVLIVGDDTANPQFIAADMLAQLEHGTDSQAICIATSIPLAERVIQEISRLKKQLPRHEILDKSIQHTVIIACPSFPTIIEMVNFYAPEHLILSMEKANNIAGAILNAGSIFLGHYTPESLGDYAIGTNHTLPTHGAARAWSGITLNDFTKTITYQKANKRGFLALAPTVETMAAAEKLEAHRMSVSLRRKYLSKEPL